MGGRAVLVAISVLAAAEAAGQMPTPIPKQPACVTPASACAVPSPLTARTVNCNGVSDDLSSQADGETITVTGGPCRVSGIVILHSNVVLRGQSVVQVVPASATTDALTLGDVTVVPHVPVQNVLVQNLAFVESGGTRFQDGIWVAAGSSDITFENVSVGSPGAGATLNAGFRIIGTPATTSDVCLFDTAVHGASAGNGYTFEGAIDGLQVFNSAALDNAEDGYAITTGGTAEFVNSIAVGNQFDGFDMGDADARLLCISSIMNGSPAQVGSQNRGVLGGGPLHLENAHVVANGGAGVVAGATSPSLAIVSSTIVDNGLMDPTPRPQIGTNGPATEVRIYNTIAAGPTSSFNVLDVAPECALNVLEGVAGGCSLSTLAPSFADGSLSTLQAGSVGVDAGERPLSIPVPLSITVADTSDHGGNPRPAVDGDYDVGAFETESAAVCGATPASGCATAGAATIKIHASKKRLTWIWKNGTATKADFGDPTASTRYKLCIYAGGTLATELAIESGPLWTDVASGYNYRTVVGNSSGVFRAKLKQGTGNAKVLIKASGANLPVPPLPFSGAPVQTRLVKNPSGGSACWAADFAAPHAANDGIQFADKEP